MKRRDALKTMGMATSHALFPSILTGFMTGCSSSEKNEYSPLFFSEDELEQLKVMVDLVLPETRSKSASQVNCHLFVDEVFAKCLTGDQQEVIKKEFNAFLEEFKRHDNKLALLSEVDQKAYTGNTEFRWFIPIKQYTLIVFFTSQEGETVASNYVSVPGDYNGNLNADKSTLNYGDTALRYYL